MSNTYKGKPDLWLLFIVIALLSIGLLMVYSATPTNALRYGDSYYFVKRHVFSLIIGSVALLFGLKMETDLLKKWASYIMLAALFLLILVFIPGAGMGANGAHRWINLFSMTFQPAEFAKIALIIFLAKELSSKALSVAVWPASAATLASIFLIVKEPDMGTAIIIIMLALIMFFIAGIPVKNFIPVIAVIAAGIIFESIKSPYKMNRLLAFRDPWKDKMGIGFHIIQSLIAVGSGGLFGLGLGGSRQKFFYLPQNYTDFIFAILCEELGLIGALSVLVLFVFFIIRGARIVRNAPEAFSMFLCGGIVFWIGIQAMLNMSVVLGLLPTTGIPLPFISYGGTSLMADLFGVGILLNVSRSIKPKGAKA